jgi:hypothetical protein
MKTNTAKPANGKPMEDSNPLSARALETARTAEAARKRAQVAKAKYKQARKAFKQAKKIAKKARKEAKLVAKALKAQSKRPTKAIAPKRLSRTQPKAKPQQASLGTPRVFVKKPNTPNALVRVTAPPAVDTGTAPSSQAEG